MSFLLTLYHWVTGIVRVLTNALALPVWAAIWAGVKAVFTEDTLWSSAKTAFSETLTWSTSEPLGIVLALVFAGFGVVHAIRIGLAGSYNGAGFLAFLVENTWALPNTVVASIFSTLTLGISIHPDSRGSGRLLLSNGIIGPYATTLGSVTAGTIVPTHEFTHVIQSWLIGPFYFPIFIANYIVNIVPWWLILKKIFNIYPNSPIQNLGHYFTRGVYPFTIFELIAYAIEGSPP
ncbi:MAG: hypothetical protein ACAI34_14055 [Verrucomicrobium sp.]